MTLKQSDRCKTWKTGFEVDRLGWGHKKALVHYRDTFAIQVSYFSESFVWEFRIVIFSYVICIIQQKDNSFDATKGTRLKQVQLKQQGYISAAKRIFQAAYYKANYLS
jgi:hypothetical protein